MDEARVAREMAAKDAEQEAEALKKATLALVVDIQHLNPADRLEATLRAMKALEVVEGKA